MFELFEMTSSLSVPRGTVGTDRLSAPHNVPRGTDRSLVPRRIHRCHSANHLAALEFPVSSRKLFATAIEGNMPMEPQNAFIGHPAQPTEHEIEAALGSATEPWRQFVGWLAERLGVSDQEWKSISPKYGWALRLKLKKRNIVYLSPSQGCFYVSFVLGDRAVRAAQESNLGSRILKAIAAAPRYAEGTGLRLVIRRAADLAPVRKLAEIKLAN